MIRVNLWNSVRVWSKTYQMRNVFIYCERRPINFGERYVFLLFQYSLSLSLSLSHSHTHTHTTNIGAHSYSYSRCKGSIEKFKKASSSQCSFNIYWSLISTKHIHFLLIFYGYYYHLKPIYLRRLYYHSGH